MKAMILAAGLGTRFRPQTLILPKPAIPFLNVPLAAFGLSSISPMSPTEIVVNTFHLPDQVEKLFSNDLKKFGRPVHFSPEKEFILGSGGGLKYAEKYFSAATDLILMNSDEVFLPENENFLKEALVQHQKEKALSTLITISHPEVGKKFGGIWTDSSNQVLGFGKEQTANSTNGHHFIGIQILSTRIFKFLTADKECNILYDGLKKAIDQDEKCITFSVQGDWFETGNLSDYLSATQECLDILSQAASPSARYLKKIMSKWAPNTRVDFSGSSIICADTTAQFNSKQIIDFAVLGAHSVIQTNVKIERSAIAADLKITADCSDELKLN